MPPMTPRQRVLTALDHQEPDRVPIIIGANNATGISMPAYRNLKKHLGIEAQDRFLYDWPELGAANLDEEALCRLHSDVRSLHDRFPAQTYARNRSRPPHSPYLDDWGVGQPEAAPGVFYPAIHPLAEAKELAEIDAYPHWPDMDDPSRFAHLKNQAARLAEENQYAIMATPWLLFPMERAMQLQGMDNFLRSMALNPDFAVELLRKIAGLCITHLSHFLRELDDNLDIIAIGDDLGAQNSLLMSPKMYRELLKPIHADYVAFIKDHTQAKVFFHTDGDVFPLLDDLVEIGVDILNPIQTSAGKMSNLAELKRRYGDALCFCGGIDTQRILPFGSPDQVRQEVRRVIQSLGSGGGYLLAAVHTITQEVPPENILAMVDAVEEFGQYPLGK